MAKQRWTAIVRSWIGQQEHGVLVVRVRRGRGPWQRTPVQAPSEVREYFNFVKLPGAGHWAMADFHTLDELRVATGARITSERGGGLRVTCAVEVPLPVTMKPFRDRKVARQKLLQLAQDIEKAEAELRRIRADRKAVPSFPWWFNSMDPPKGDFEWKGEEAGDWTPYWSDGYWRKTAQAETIYRRAGKRGVEICTVDEDGNWDFDARYEDGDPLDQWRDLYLWHLNVPDEHFLGWAQYHYWCAVNGGDPLEEFMWRQPKRVDHFEAAHQNLKYFWMNKRKGGA